MAMTPKPWLLYSYPWMPFPRRIAIYLREKNIPPSLIQIVPVSDPQLGNAAAPGFPPRPAGSLPLLVISSQPGKDDKIYIRQSVAIMNYIDEFCDAGLDGFPKSKYPMRGDDALSRAREIELLALAEELTIAWNPVRMFGSGAGTMRLPAASKEMMGWIHRPLATIESWFQGRDFGYLRKDSKEDKGKGPTMAEIVLYQFLEFTKDCYGVDVTKMGSGEVVKDVYGREVERKYVKLGEFFEAFEERDSAKRDVQLGEVASEEVLERMQDWSEGSL